MFKVFASILVECDLIINTRVDIEYILSSKCVAITRISLDPKTLQHDLTRVICIFGPKVPYTRLTKLYLCVRMSMGV